MRGGPFELRGCLLLVMNSGFRVPGSPVVHCNEIQPGELFFNRARAHMLLGAVDTADADLTAALSANSVHPHFTHARGVACVRKGATREALDFFHRALELDGVSPPHCLAAVMSVSISNNPVLGCFNPVNMFDEC